MKTYFYKEYKVSLCLAPTYSFNSTDNKYYDKVIAIEKSDFNKCIELEISKDDEKKTVLIVAPFYTPVESCMVLNDNGMFIMLDATICLLDIESFEIVKKVELDATGTMFQAYAYENDYILYGEMKIFRINRKLEIVWEFSARDIFVRYQGEEPAFIMKDDRICLMDFSDRYYEVDYNGNLLLDKMMDS